MTPRRFFRLLLACFTLTGCAHRIDYGPRGPILDPHVILDVLQERYARVQSLRSEGRLSVESPEGSGSLRIALEVAKPGCAYLETADFLGNPRGTFATDGEEFVFFEPGENVFYAGSASARLLGRFLPVELGPEELVALLLGQPPLLEGDEVRLEVEPEGVYRLDLRRGSIRQRVRVGTRDLRLISVETRGRPAVDLRALEHRIVEPDLPLPAALELHERRSGTTVRIRLGDPAWNVETDDSLFRLRPPPGARVERLEEEGGN